MRRKQILLNDIPKKQLRQFRSEIMNIINIINININQPFFIHF